MLEITFVCLQLHQSVINSHIGHRYGNLHRHSRHLNGSQVGKSGWVQGMGSVICSKSGLAASYVTMPSD